MRSFCRTNPCHKIPPFRGGGGECRFYFYGREDFSETCSLALMHTKLRAHCQRVQGEMVAQIAVVHLFSGLHVSEGIEEQLASESVRTACLEQPKVGACAMIGLAKNHPWMLTTLRLRSRLPCTDPPQHRNFLFCRLYISDKGWGWGSAQSWRRFVFFLLAFIFQKQN